MYPGHGGYRSGRSFLTCLEVRYPALTVHYPPTPSTRNEMSYSILQNHYDRYVLEKEIIPANGNITRGEGGVHGVTETTVACRAVLRGIPACTVTCDIDRRRGWGRVFAN